ncbi:MAG: aminotransferase class IV, partial [Conexibacter sp.]
LGAHKWRDRRLVEALAATGTTPLLLDADGVVLEAAWGNVFALEGALLVTPPTDGRLLPGVTRAALLDVAEEAGLAVTEAELPLERLAAADAIVVSSALAGALPAQLEGRRGDELGAAALARQLALAIGIAREPARA